MSVKSDVQKNESLRQWYTRKTRPAIRWLLAASFATMVSGVLLWVLADLPFLARMQTFNGAIIIPAFGGIWIASFMFIWLIPMRELSFRGQESLDRTEERMKKALEESLLPAADVWKRIGDRVEQELLPRLEKVAKEAEARIGPTAQSVRRMENQAEAHLGLLVTEVREAAGSIKQFFGPKGAPPDYAAAAEYLAETNPKNGTVPARRV